MAARLSDEALDEGSRMSRLLQTAPALAPFPLRARVFRSLCAADREAFGQLSQQMVQSLLRGEAGLRVRRDRLFEDGFDRFGAMTAAELKGQIRIVFVNEYGAEEAGVDGGGLFKDFLVRAADLST